MATTSNRSVITDTRVYAADGRVNRNILSIRSSVSADGGYSDIQTLVVKSGKSITLSDLPQSLSFTLYSQQPVFVTGTVVGNSGPTNYTGQTYMNLTTGMNSVTISNTTLIDTVVTVIRLSLSEVQYIMPRHLVTFAALSRIAPIGYAVNTLAKVQVTDVTLFPLINDQVMAPSNGAGQRFRICDSLGNPSPTGNYIMYLNDIVTQQNFSGNLQLWIDELA